MLALDCSALAGSRDLRKPASTQSQQERWRRRRKEHAGRLLLSQHQQIVAR